jgi:hypothetical protein
VYFVFKSYINITCGQNNLFDICEYFHHIQTKKKVNPQSDRITVDGALISVRLPEEVKWIAIHKPKGVVTTTKDEKVVWALE